MVEDGEVNEVCRPEFRPAARFTRVVPTFAPPMRSSQPMNNVRETDCKTTDMPTTSGLNINASDRGCTNRHVTTSLLSPVCTERIEHGPDSRGNSIQVLPCSQNRAFSGAKDEVSNVNADFCKYQRNLEAKLLDLEMVSGSCDRDTVDILLRYLGVSLFCTVWRRSTQPSRQQKSTPFGQGTGGATSQQFNVSITTG
jgi:hypothetical protein